MRGKYTQVKTYSFLLNSCNICVGEEKSCVCLYVNGCRLSATILVVQEKSCDLYSVKCL